MSATDLDRIKSYYYGMISLNDKYIGRMLESLADFDDKLLEQLLEDTMPSKEDIYSHLARNLAADRVVPVLLGAAATDAGVRRLLKSLRHDVPEPSSTMTRLGLQANGGPLAQVFKTQHAAHTGKVSIARIWAGSGTPIPCDSRD